MQSGRLQLQINGAAQPLDEGEVAAMPDAAANVAGVYAMLRDDILNGTASAPGFNHALQLTRMIGAVHASSMQGVRQKNDGWPTDQVG